MVEKDTGNINDPVELLNSALSFFNDNTQKLTQAYSKLEDEVASINKELENKNNQLQQKITEVDHIKSHLENVLNSISTAVVAVDLNLNIILINKQAETLFHIKANDFYNKKVDRLIVIKKNSNVNMIDWFDNIGLCADIETVVICENGYEIEVSLTCTDIKNSSINKIGYLILMRDLREIKKLRQKARRADRLVALGEMAARVAHEIRNPLGGIEGFASLLARTLQNDADNKRLAEYIMEGVKSVNHIVTSLLDYARPIRLKKNTFSVREAVLEVCNNINLTRTPTVRVQLEFSRLFEPVITADRILFQQVIWNLMSNSLQAAQRPGIIKITCNRLGKLKRQVDDCTLLFTKNSLDFYEADFFSEFDDKNNGSKFWYALSISDQGEGIDPDTKEKIFYPFYTTKENGTGLGLSTAYKIIEEHEWKIAVNSQIGRGTRFTIFLPNNISILEEAAV